MDIIRHIRLGESLIRPLEDKQYHGAWTFIARNEPLEWELHRLFGRRDLCLKVFKKPARALEEFTWGQAILLTECTKVQNLFGRGIGERRAVGAGDRFHKVGWQDA